MLLDDVFFYFLIGIGALLSLPALWLLMRARWPHRTAKLRRVAEGRVWLSFLTGLLPLVAVIAVDTIMLKKVKTGDPGVLAISVLFTGLAVTWGFAGMAGLATLIGEKLPGSGTNDPAWKSTLRGGVILVCVFAMPYIGWFALLPLSIVTGAGMMVRAMFVRLPQEAPQLQTHPAPVQTTTSISPPPPMTVGGPPSIPVSFQS